MSSRVTIPRQSGGAERHQGLIRRVNRRLGQMHIAAATAVLVLAVVFAVVAITIPLTAMGLYDDGRHVVWGAITVSALVAAPFILYVQITIRQLQSSRRALRLLTERLALARANAERESEEKSRFLATMSHELRTPLNAIIGFSEVIRDEHLGALNHPRYAEYVRDIHASGQHLLAIIGDILDLAKIEAGSMELDRDEVCDAAQAIGAAARMIRPLAERQGVRLEVAPPDSEIVLTAADRMVRQILINVLSNAVKFTPQGGTVSLSTQHRPDGGLKIAIADTGIGMSADEIRLALTPFGQVGNAANRRQAGTGLGLPLAKAMMELHGGQLHVRSAPQRGTTVTLAFPPARAPGTPTPSRRAKAGSDLAAEDPVASSHP